MTLLLYQVPCLTFASTSPPPPGTLLVKVFVDQRREAALARQGESLESSWWSKEKGQRSVPEGRTQWHESPPIKRWPQCSGRALCDS